MSAQKPILISGAGLSSLLLGRSLARSKIPFLIFERDASLIFRAQGYRLRLSREGLAAIEEVLDPEAFQQFYDKCGKTGGAGFSAIDPISGETLDNQQTAVAAESLLSRDNKVIGISRGDMRAQFLQGIESHIRWSHHVTDYELTPDGVRAVFADGSKSEEGALLVAGDGLNSRIAKKMSDGKIKVYDTGARGIHGQAPTTAFKGLGEGVFRFVDEQSRPDGKVFLITNVRPEDMNDPSVEFGWTMGGSPGVIVPPNNDHTIIGTPAAELAKALTAAWHPRVKALFDNMNEKEAAFWKITCSSPDGVPEWENKPRVTGIGDAVHSMTPASGNGANTAVRDSALLGRLLAEAGGFKEGVTAAYEKEMRVYASEAVKNSYSLAFGMFGVKIDETTPTI